MYEQVCYQKNYIDEVICRLDFASSIDALNSNMPKEIYSAVKETYPIAEPQDVIGTEFQINPLSVPVVNHIMKKQWVFLSRNRLSRCTINAETVIFSIKDYSTFENMQSSLLKILHVIMEVYPECQGKRLGLRYINMLPNVDKGEWIDEKFFSALSAHKDEKTTRLITSLEYAIPEKDLLVHLQYGYPNPDYPAIMKSDVFTIDIDSYSTGIIYSDDVQQLIEDMHSEDQKCFETMITDCLRKELNER